MEGKPCGVPKWRQFFFSTGHMAAISEGKVSINLGHDKSQREIGGVV